MDLWKNKEMHLSWPMDWFLTILSINFHWHFSCALQLVDFPFPSHILPSALQWLVLMEEGTHFNALRKLKGKSSFNSFLFIWWPRWPYPTQSSLFTCAFSPQKIRPAWSDLQTALSYWINQQHQAIRSAAHSNCLSLNLLQGKFYLFSHLIIKVCIWLFYSVLRH